MTAYDTVLFDNDGVLVDPPAAETQAAAIRDAFAAVGVDSPEQAHVEYLCGGVFPDGLRDIATEYDLDPAELWTAREEYDERSQFAKFRDGTRDTYDDVTAITDLDQPMGVVSSNHHSTIEFILDHFGLHDVFDTYYGREMTIDSLTRKKPNTHYLDRAMADIGGDSALYVGDSDTDVLAAHRAGMDSVFVRREHSRDTELTEAATYEVTDLHGVADIVGG
ncbi:HAD-IA family hydrolase [Haloarchaeobius sp. HME9146]|uniref:HAD family hydrolase n=1 Tax=Haloarchaeobius sp. HME9146 TaxID=2978732 RepID=UPI0021C0437A|nr:HAD-IA family hydrolase [Haloarchaeobius sp. HME9146]